MGRPPIGKRALTPAEKQRRYRARLKAQPQSSTDATARVRELEALLAESVAANKRLTATADKYMIAMKQRIEELEALAAITAKRGQPELFAHIKHVQYALALYDLLSCYVDAIKRRVARSRTRQRRKPRR
jgi:hypothetical protein